MIDLSITGWSAQGFRCPDHEVTVTRSDKKFRATLIQMPNGTGKTTTLELLRAALSGEAEKWTTDGIRDFAAPGGDGGKGTFVVRLNVSGKPLTFELVLDFDKGQTKYRTTVGSGVRPGHSPPPEVRRFMRSDFVRLFVFDGELAGALLEPKQTRARDAIDSLFQLSLLGNVSDKFQEHWETHAGRVTAKEEKGLNRRRNRLKRLEGRLKTARDARKAVGARAAEVQEQINKLDRDYQTRLRKKGSVGSEIDRITGLVIAAETRVATLAARSVEEMRDPHALAPQFADSLIALKDNLDKLRLPDSTSREFFDELIAGEECICGAPLNAANRSVIKAKAATYLVEDEFGILNNIKSGIGELSLGFPESPADLLQKTLGELAAATKERGALRTELQALRDERHAERDPELDAARTGLQALRTELAEANDKIREADRDGEDDDEEETSCIKALEQMVKKAGDEYAEATQTQALRKKTELIRDILQVARDLAREELREVLVRESNATIIKLLVRTPVVIEDVQDNLILKHQKRASVGQTLSVGYAFLATLFDRAEHKLPFIVDSPAGPLDLAVRGEVARILPKLTRQCIAFTISSERAGFVDPLDEAAGKGGVQYLTLFRKTAATADMMKRMKRESVNETANGYVVAGRTFFDAFDVEEE
jgi:DNA sulfur modification protein DndD